MPAALNLAGIQYNRLTGIKRIGVLRRRALWLFRCKCGNTLEACAADVKSGNTKSCGCLLRDLLLERNTKHGQAHSLTYRIWCGMKSRCYTSSATGYKWYGAKGIRVCAEWRDSFEVFLADMGTCPNGGYSIDRIDGSGNYEPSNCRWATLTEQANNRRSTRLITYNKKTLSMFQWSKLLGGSRGLVKHRINSGWSDERSVSTPVCTST